MTLSSVTATGTEASRGLSSEICSLIELEVRWFHDVRAWCPGGAASRVVVRSVYTGLTDSAGQDPVPRPFTSSLLYFPMAIMLM